MIFGGEGYESEASTALAAVGCSCVVWWGMGKGGSEVRVCTTHSAGAQSSRCKTAAAHWSGDQWSQAGPSEAELGLLRGHSIDKTDKLGIRWQRRYQLSD